MALLTHITFFQKLTFWPIFHKFLKYTIKKNNNKITPQHLYLKSNFNFNFWLFFILFKIFSTCHKSRILLKYAKLYSLTMLIKKKFYFLLLKIDFIILLYTKYGERKSKIVQHPNKYILSEFCEMIHKKNNKE